MAWKYPKRLPRANNVVDYRDFNDGLMHVVEEDGRLNEHNWNEDLKTQLTRGTDLADDVGFRVRQKTDEIDASYVYTGVGVYEPDFVEVNAGWTVIPEMSTTVTTRGGLMYVLCSMQIGSGDIDMEAVSFTRLAVRLDGAVLPLSVIGCQDFGAIGPWMETGMSGRLMGVDLDHTFPVTAGQHTIDIVADVRSLTTLRSVPTSTVATNHPTDVDLRAAFYNKELVVWEIR